MAEPTLVQVFGTGATQDSNTVTISKSALTGLNPTSSNSAESILTAILLKAATYLTDTNRDANADQSLAISIATQPSFTTRGESVYIRDSISVELDKPAGVLDIDPDDY